jgi:plastocyanin
MGERRFRRAYRDSAQQRLGHAISAKGTGRVTLHHAGEVDYFCRFHPNMTGRISVAPE